MNKIMLIGNLGRDPEMNYTPSGVAVTKFSLAVSHSTRTASGEWQNETDWFNIVAWRDLAERCNTYLKKGNKVYIGGRLTQRKYTDRTGVERTSLEVIANEMENLTPKDRQTGSGSSSADTFAGDDALGDLDEHPF